MTVLFIIGLVVLQLHNVELLREGNQSAKYPVYGNSKASSTELFWKAAPLSIFQAAILPAIVGAIGFILVGLSNKEFDKHLKYLDTKDYRKLKAAFNYWKDYPDSEYGVLAGEKLLTHPLFKLEDFPIQLRVADLYFRHFSKKEFPSKEELFKDEHLNKSKIYFCKTFSEKSEEEIDTFQNKSGWVSRFYYSYGWFIKLTGEPCEGSSSTDPEFYRVKACNLKGSKEYMRNEYPDKFDYLA